MLRKSLSPNLLAILTANGQVIAEVASPTTMMAAPLKQNCRASLVVEYSVRLRPSMVTTLFLEAIYGVLTLKLDLVAIQESLSRSLDMILQELLHNQVVLSARQQMFCCSRREAHRGQIVVSVCTQPQCTQSKNQLACAQCLQEEHSGHSTTSMKQIVPDLLQAHTRQLLSESKLDRLLQFVTSQFGSEFIDGQSTSVHNITDRVQQLLVSLKREVESTGEEISKMRSIFKNLNKTGNSQVIPKQTHPGSKIPTKMSQFDAEEPPFKERYSPTKSQPFGSTAKSKVFGQSPQANINSKTQQIDTFSISSKHPYLHLSPDLRTVSKTSHSGHRFAVAGAQPLHSGESELRLLIDKSVSGNIMLGICHQATVREKDYSNCYGINSGTYLIGQNGNNPTTAISFHNSLTVFNRKQIVGWNFQSGDEVVVGVNFEEELVFFRREGKRGQAQFTMRIRGQNKSQTSIVEMALKIIVLLQAEGDQVTILEQD